MRLLILGAGGMAGHVIGLYFQEKGYDVTALSRRSLPFFKTNLIGDVTEIDFLTKLLRDNYDVVINCIGILNKDAEDRKSDAVFLNSYLPHFIADHISNSKTKLIHMGTDCVFAGNTGPYTEGSLKDGRTFYDRTKALGEIECDKNLTFRNSIIGPDINQDGIGLFHWFMSQANSVTGFSGAIWTGVTTTTLAKAIEKAIEVDLSGLYNLVNNSSISKYDLLHLFNKHFKSNSIEIKFDNSTKMDKTLICTRSDFSFIVPSYEQMILEMKEWVLKHSDIYRYTIK